MIRHLRYQRHFVKLFLVFSFFFGWTVRANACTGDGLTPQTFTPSSWADIANCVSMVSASGNDIIAIGNVSWTASTQLNISNKAFTLQGNGCTPTTFTSSISNLTFPYPTSTCNTTISLTMANNINWTCQPFKLSRITGIKFISDGTNTGGSFPPIEFDCDNQQSGGAITRVRFDHNYYNYSTAGNAGRLVIFNSTVGVVDHNYFENDANQLFLIYSGNWYGTSGEAPYGSNDQRGTGNESRFYPIDYPGTQYYQAIIFENNTFNQVTVGTGATKGCTDAGWGARFIVRFNNIISCHVGTHGLESDGWARADRNVQVYGNSYTMTGYGYHNLEEIRDGQFLYTFLNSAKDLTSARSAGVLSNYRVDTPTSWFGPADGLGPNADTPTAGNPQNVSASCTSGGSGHECSASSGSGLTVTVTGADFTNTVGYLIKKTGCTEDFTNSFACHSMVQSISNLGQTINFLGAPAGTSLSFTTGDHFSLNLTTRNMDMPGVIDQVMLKNYHSPFFAGFKYGITQSGGVTTIGFDRCAPDADIGVGDTISVQSGNTTFDGLWVVASRLNVNDADLHCGAGTHDALTFNYGGGTPNISASNVVKIPSPISGFQANDPLYQWLNTDTDSGSCSTPCNLLYVYNNADPRFIITDAQLSGGYGNAYNYNGTAQSGVGTPFNGNDFTHLGVGVGTIARRPSNCQKGQAYWSLDEGAWNNSGFTYTVNATSYSNGRLYQCTATNTWTLVFTPYDYPHPLTQTQDALAFTTQPATIVSGANFSPNVVVTCKLPDLSGTDTSCTGTVTLTMNACGATLTGSATQSLSSGVATYAARGATSSGVTGCAFTASVSGGTVASSAISTSFDVTSSCTPDHLTFTAQPSSVNTGVSLGTVTVVVKDSGGVTCTGDTSTIIIANKAATCTGMALGGTTSGANQFTTTNLTEDHAGACTLHATDGALTPADSNAFTISAGASLGTSASRISRKH